MEWNARKGGINSTYHALIAMSPSGTQSRLKVSCLTTHQSQVATRECEVGFFGTCHIILPLRRVKNGED